MEGLPGWGISSMPGPPPRQHEHERRYTPGTHLCIPTRRIRNDDNGGQMIFGELVGLKFPDICLTGEGKIPKKKLTQDTCPDWGSNLSLLRGSRACYRLFHSGGHVIHLTKFFSPTCFPRNWKLIITYKTSCVVWLWNLVSHLERGLEVKNVRE